MKKLIAVLVLTFCLSFTVGVLADNDHYDCERGVLGNGCRYLICCSESGRGCCKSRICTDRNGVEHEQCSGAQEVCHSTGMCED